MYNHFAEYNDILIRINEIQLKILEIRETLYSIKGIKYDELPSKGATPQADVTYFLIEIEELEAELDILYDKKQVLRGKHEKEINKVSDARERSVLRMYYLMKFDIYKIAEALKISVSHTRKIKRDAIESLINVITNDSEK